jgi:histidinol-phosphatase (PHP family)
MARGRTPDGNRGRLRRPMAESRSAREPPLNDLHVHTEWSYDAPDGSMEETCRRAADMGVPAVAFTEHADFGPSVPPLDVDGYLATVERCRTLFPSLRILSGIELGEAHHFPKEAEALLSSASLDLVLGSVHRIAMDGRLVEVDEEILTPSRARETAHAYFQETLDLLEHPTVFAVLAHADYPKRYWPHEEMPYVETDFEEEYRTVLKAAASAGVALEINTDGSVSVDPGPCPGPVVIRWWREAGGAAVTFASDAHAPEDICAGFDVAGGVAQAAGFRPAPHDFGFWLR